MTRTVFTPPPISQQARNALHARLKAAIVDLVEVSHGLDYVEIAHALNLRLRVAIQLCDELVAEGRILKQEEEVHDHADAEREAAHAG